MLFEGQVLESSSILVILGAALLYFGKIISETHISKHTKLDLYSQGLFFVSIFVFFPGVVAAYLSAKVEITPPAIWILPQILTLLILGQILIAHEHLRRHGILDYFKDECKRKFDELRKGKIIKKERVLESEESLRKMTGLDFSGLTNALFYELPIEASKNSLFKFAISLIAFMAVFQNWGDETTIIFAITAISSFLMLSTMAIAHGFSTAKYPICRILRHNGKSMRGKLIKYGDDFVVLLKENKVYSINKNNISHIEQRVIELPKVKQQKKGAR